MPSFFAFQSRWRVRYCWSAFWLLWALLMQLGSWIAMTSPKDKSYSRMFFKAASVKTIRKNQKFKSFLEYTVDLLPKRRCQVRSEKSTKTKTSTKMVQVPITWLSIVLLVWTLIWNIKEMEASTIFGWFQNRIDDPDSEFWNALLTET